MAKQSLATPPNFIEIVSGRIANNVLCIRPKAYLGIDLEENEYITYDESIVRCLSYIPRTGLPDRAKKLYDYIFSIFITGCPRSKKGKIEENDCTVIISIELFANLCNIDISTKNRFDTFKKEVDSSIRMLMGIYNQIIYKDESEEAYGVICRYRYKNKKYHIVIDSVYAENILESKVSRVPESLFKIPDRRHSYSIGRKINEHLATFITQNNGNILKVETLVKNFAPNLVLMDDLKTKGRRDWKRLIQEPFREMLEILAFYGIITDYHLMKSGKELTDEEYDILTSCYETWIKLSIRFEFPSDVNEYYKNKQSERYKKIKRRQSDSKQGK